MFNFIYNVIINNNLQIKILLLKEIIVLRNQLSYSMGLTWVYLTFPISLIEGS